MTFNRNRCCIKSEQTILWRFGWVDQNIRVDNLLFCWLKRKCMKTFLSKFRLRSHETFQQNTIILTESVIPQSIRWAQMVNSASPDGTALHALPSAAAPAPRRRYLPSTCTPLLNISACTTTSMESGWHLTTTGRARGSALSCWCAAANGGWLWYWVSIPETIAPVPRLYANRGSARMQNKMRTTIHPKDMFWGAILCLEQVWREWRTQ